MLVRFGGGRNGRSGERLNRVLTNDPGIGVARHVDAGYEESGKDGAGEGCADSDAQVAASSQRLEGTHGFLSTAVSHSHRALARCPRAPKSQEPFNGFHVEYVTNSSCLKDFPQEKKSKPLKRFCLLMRL